MTNEEIEELYYKWLSQEISDEEIERLVNEMPDGAVGDMITDFLEDDNMESSYIRTKADHMAERVRNSLVSRIGEKSKTSNQRPLYKSYLKYIAAACVLLVAVTSYWTWKKIGNNPTLVENAMVAHDVQPGGNAAVLLLENGEQIVLNPNNNTLIVDDSVLRYQDGTAVSDSEAKVMMQTMRVPKGGEYRITLSDGTSVMLNSDSELTFPSRFDTDRRAVKLRGEAYFEVAKAYTKGQQRKPFFVHTEKQSIEVLGTKFNVLAYPEDPLERTTLAEGKVNVKVLEQNKELILLPSQQATWNGKALLMEQADLDVALAWTRGEFYFQDASIIQIMRQLERWYDIEVVFNGVVEGTFGGKISKTRNLSNVVEMLQSTNTIKCKIVGRRLYVTN